MSVLRAQQIAELVAEAGDFRATCDPRAVQTPCILVHPVPARDWTDATYAGPTLRWEVVALATPPGDLVAAADLDAMASQIITALEGDLQPIEAVARAYRLTDQADLPALIFTLEEYMP